jgi:hypothetical protein
VREAFALRTEVEGGKSWKEARSRKELAEPGGKRRK